MEKRTGHLTGKELEDWMAGRLSPEEERLLLAHAGTCDCCADLLGACLEQNLMEPPAYLQEEILEKSQSLEVRTARSIYHTSRQMRLFLYSLKVGFALAVSLMVLFMFPGPGKAAEEQRTCLTEDAQMSVTERLRDGGEKLNVLLDSLIGRPVFTEYEEGQND